ncbi:hypothetical protein [Propylenella binzhouense]|uniref:Uncharacterized protein n=1 Tax=Propylenella binzhouense TaxID=2555902 RepID=A0A964T8D4_9HYPH|nr:hypothetical protein [Propylenella binzhouense]MYZ49649.1 hypothetical protein [Propylenella binzhouense]
MRDRPFATWPSRPYGAYLRIHAAVAAAAREGRILYTREIVEDILNAAPGISLDQSQIEHALVLTAAAQGVPLVIGDRGPDAARIANPKRDAAGRPSGRRPERAAHAGEEARSWHR